MTLYLDASALLKRYIAEPDSAEAVQVISRYRVLATSRIAEVEVRRNLARLLEGPALRSAQVQFKKDLGSLTLVAVDDLACSEASRIAEETGCRSLDAIHLAAVRRLGASTVILTYDHRQAQAASSLGLTVVGV